MIPTTKDRKYQICTRCVMDTTDPDISFDEEGVCSHCKFRDKREKHFVFIGEEREQRLEKLVSEIKSAGRGKRYDCIIGVSGGIDSTFVAYIVKKVGLRPLAVHLDNGWDSELAVKNIEETLKRLQLDLYTHVIDWSEFKDIQLSFLRASTPDLEIPSDHAIVSLMRKMAIKVGVQYIISGVNIRTESHLPTAWSQGHLDWRYIKNVHKTFGSGKIETFPHMNLMTVIAYSARQKWVDILNYLDYNKETAKRTITQELCWKDYGWKHFESIYTRFYQGYILPQKFGFDKRKTHFSSLICSGEMTRAEALQMLNEEPYPRQMQEDDRAYVIKKFGLRTNEFEAIMNLPAKSYWDYPSYRRFYSSRFFELAKYIYRRYLRY